MRRRDIEKLNAVVATRHRVRQPVHSLVDRELPAVCCTVKFQPIQCAGLAASGAGVRDELTVVIRAQVSVFFGATHRLRDQAQPAGACLNIHFTKVATTDQWRDLRLEQGPQRSVRLGPSIPPQDDFHNAKLALRLTFESDRQSFQLVLHRPLVTNISLVTLGEEVLLRPAAHDLTCLLKVLLVQNDLDRACHQLASVAPRASSLRLICRLTVDLSLPAMLPMSS